MTNATLIPPKHNPPTPRERLRGLAAGAVVGVVVGSIAWWFFGGLLWFSAIPACAVFGWWESEFFRPNVLWGHRGPKVAVAVARGAAEL